MKNSYESLLIIFLITFTLVAQSYGQSEAGAEFLLIAPGARAGAMGEAQVALADDAYAGYYNPAGLSFVSTSELSAMHMNWLPGLADDIFYEYLTACWNTNSIGSFGLQVTYMTLGEINHTNEDGPEVLDTFSSHLWNIGVSYSRQVLQHTSLGITLKFVRQMLAPASVLENSTVDAASSTILFDIGLLSHSFLGNRLDLGIALSNLGGAIKTADNTPGDPAPTRLKFGLNWLVLNTEKIRMNILYDVNQPLIGYLEVEQNTQWYSNTITRRLLHNVGGEVWFWNILALRAGGFYQKAGSVHTKNHTPIPTIGAGVHLGKYGVDFGYVLGDQGDPFRNTMRFSVNLIL